MTFNFYSYQKNGNQKKLAFTMKFTEMNHVMTNTQPIKSLSEYIHAINYISHTFNDNLWYRGHAQDTYLNLPSMLRDGTWKDDDFSYRTEHDIFKTFKRKSKLKKETDYEYLHIMQHFGLPTRLLDFTESSLIALFFAGIATAADSSLVGWWKMDADDSAGNIVADSSGNGYDGTKETNVQWDDGSLKFSGADI